MTKFGLLGEPAMCIRGREVDPGPAKQRCVLAALALDAGRVVPVAQLIDRVWGAEVPPRPRATLSSYVSRLRRLLANADTAILRRSAGYLLETHPKAVDVHLFRDHCARARAMTDEAAVVALAEALRLWRGEALTGLGGEWAGEERERLGRERLAAECDLADRRLRLGQGGGLIAELTARAAALPLDERVAGQLMHALCQAGRMSDALAHYCRVRARLIADVGTEPQQPLRSLHERILATDPVLLGGSSAVTLLRASVPRQLPAAPAPFLGRRAELAMLDETAAGRDHVVVSSLAGAGGTGKTWLALHWAHRNLARFPDGQLFVDLNGSGPAGSAMPSGAALSGFLEALGVPAHRVPARLHAQEAMFRSLVAGRRMLIVLDNAENTAQVTPLLPGKGVTVLVTSRRRLTGLLVRHGARHVSLGRLADEDARALLACRLGHTRVAAEPAAVSGLLERCQGHPLALSLAAAQYRPGTSLAELVRELSSRGIEALEDDGDPATDSLAVLS